jgi:hypothetical protein
VIALLRSFRSGRWGAARGRDSWALAVPAALPPTSAAASTGCPLGPGGSVKHVVIVPVRQRASGAR